MITEEMVLQNIAGATQYILAQKKWTHEAMAEYLGVSVGQISKWRNGLQKPDILVICKMAELSGETVDTILTHNINEEAKIKERDEQQRTILAAISGNEGILRMMNLKSLLRILLEHIKEVARDSSDDRALQLYEFGADLGDIECVAKAMKIVKKEIKETLDAGFEITEKDPEYALIEKEQYLQELAEDLLWCDTEDGMTHFTTKVHMKKYINPDRLKRHLDHYRNDQIPKLRELIEKSIESGDTSGLWMMKTLYNSWVCGAYPPEQARQMQLEYSKDDYTPMPDTRTDEEKRKAEERKEKCRDHATNSISLKKLAELEWEERENGLRASKNQHQGS